MEFPVLYRLSEKGRGTYAGGYHLYRIGDSQRGDKIYLPEYDYGLVQPLNPAKGFFGFI